MQKLALAVLLALLTISVVYTYPIKSTVAQALNMGDLLTRAFAATGARAEGYSVHNWSVVNNTYMSAEELTQIGQKLNSVLQISDAREYKTSEDRQEVYQLHGNWDPATEVTLLLKSMKLQDRQPQTVLVIKIERDSNRLQDMTQSIEKVKNTAALVSVAPQISTCIEGFQNDRIDGTERNQLIDRVFTAVNASEIEAIRAESLSSVSGYSPLAKEYIKSNEKHSDIAEKIGL